MKITIEDLKKNKVGTPCGDVGPNDTALSQPLVIDFIETFFNGELDNVDTYVDNGILYVTGGNPKLSKLTITNDEFKHFTSFLTEDELKNEFSDFAEFLEISDNVDDVEDVDEEIHPEIICWLFSMVVGHYGGSFRADHIDNGEIDLESE